MDKRDEENSETYGIPSNITTAALAKLPLALVLTNPHLDGNPIIYANNAFGRITGYAAAAAIGRNCRFLQGDETDPEHARQIGEAAADALCRDDGKLTGKRPLAVRMPTVLMERESVGVVS